ncbi:MAG: hypothetical protein HYZ28_01920 [Myxococcales bacterium]|nr:hypothetical protein [Myxococcales bacterium]
MQLVLTAQFQRDVRALAPEDRPRVFELLLALPQLMGQPHLHSGLGLRKLHPRGIFEARLGLGLRLLFAFGSNTATLIRIATHEEVKHYLKSL